LRNAAARRPGRALYWSTLGSFLGSVTLSLVVMQAFGVWAAVLLGTLMLVAGAILVQRPSAGHGRAAGGVLALGLLLNLRDRERIDTAYADYEVLPVERDGMISPRAFVVNNQYASLIDDSKPPPMPATCSTSGASCSTTSVFQ
jgi:hypothetical protein